MSLFFVYTSVSFLFCSVIYQWKIEESWLLERPSRMCHHLILKISFFSFSPLPFLVLIFFFNFLFILLVVGLVFFIITVIIPFVSFFNPPLLFVKPFSLFISSVKSIRDLDLLHRNKIHEIGLAS